LADQGSQAVKVQLAEPFGFEEELGLPRNVISGVQVLGHAPHQEAQHRGSAVHAVILLWLIQPQVN